MPLRVKRNAKFLTTLSAMALALSGCGTSEPPQGDYRSPEPGFNAPLTEFSPPKDLTIRRSYVMKTGDYKIGEMSYVQRVDAESSHPLIRRDVESVLSLELNSMTYTYETVWIGKDGLVAYNGKFKQDGKDDVTLTAKLENGVMNFDAQEKKDGKIYHQEFVPGKDYHWSTIYPNLRNRELIQGKRYKRQILDMSFARLKSIEEVYLGMKEFKLGDQVIDCHVLWFDYGHVNATIWVAEDELGWFLVYEDAQSTDGPFELILDSYTKSESE